MFPRSKIFQSVLLRLIVRYRWLIYELILRDLRLRYRGSVFGFAWTLLNPLFFVAIYVLIFGTFLKVGVKDYALYLLCGLLPWNWFAGAVQQGTSAIVDGRNFVGKTIFPTEALIFVPMASNAVNFALSLPLLLGAMLLFHVPLTWGLLALPFVVLAQALLTLAVLFVLATLNVFYRDFQQLVGYIILLLFYLVPIIYPTTSIPAPLRTPLLLDPLAVIVVSYQDIFYHGTVPDLAAIAYACLAGVFCVAGGYAIFQSKRELLSEYL